VHHVKRLLDENLSPAVAVVLRGDGIDAVHIRDRGMTSATDGEVLDRAYEDDRILVTANVGDFERLSRARELHAGIALVEDGDLLRAEQEAVIRRIALAIEVEYAEARDMVNRIMRVSRAGSPMFDAPP
jgi:predicted nuclease of predicted toxin-antitoxin system